MSTGKTIILGIDPGIADTGYGIIAAQGPVLSLIGYGSIKTSKALPLAERLIQLRQELLALIATHQPQCVSIEQLFFAKNTKTALTVGQARGVAMMTCREHTVDIQEFTPLQIKQAVTGYGQADKQQIQLMVKSILGLNEIPRPDDAADALAAAICAAASLNFFRKTINR